MVENQSMNVVEVFLRRAQRRASASSLFLDEIALFSILV